MANPAETAGNPFEIGLESCAANDVPLTPVSFLRRAASVYPGRIAIQHGSHQQNWAETYVRARRLASALQALGVKRGDVVSAMLPNTPAMVEAHFGIPMAGAVLNAINTRLDPATIGFILDHAEAKIVLTDSEFAPVMKQALKDVGTSPIVIDVEDFLGPSDAERIGTQDYESLLMTGDPDFEWHGPEDEWDAITLNYTSGTTGNPKGVIYHHRGAYLNALSNILTWSMKGHPNYLWTLPMFHCNGWCFPWTLPILAGTNVCLRRVESKAIYDAIADHGITHLCGAPIVMQMIAGASAEERRDFSQEVEMMTAAAPPPATVLADMKRQGFTVTHVYGLTEVYGPAVVCAWHDEWDELPIEEQADLQARQGVRYPMLTDLMVADPQSLTPLPHDGSTLGEVFMRGNIVMKGYLKNADASDKAFDGGWFHTGDLGVTHPDGYIEMKDRSKDLIISGGENISSIEIETALYKHPAVAAVAVVAKPDVKWGETPCAFIELKSGQTATEHEMVAHCREHLAGFKVPRAIVFGSLPKTSTGKIQKFELRKQFASA
ncbi:MAG: acyl-CoA synthetase [Pseudomonadota bacterium]